MKKSNLSPKKGIAKNKRVLIIIILLFIGSLGIIGLSLSKRGKFIFDENTRYFTGNLYTANHAANMLDYSYNKKNIVISPYNVNTSLAILYNATDNNSNKEIKSYFKEDINKVNTKMAEKIQTNIEEKKSNDKYTTLYEKYITEIQNNSYEYLTIDTIKLLTNKEKEEILLLLKKASLSFERINNLNNLSEKKIKNYELSGKEVSHNDYYLKQELERVLNDYESYSIKNEVINYTEIYTNTQKVKEEFKNNTQQYNLKITELKGDITEDTKTINDNIKSVTSNNITRVVDESLLNEDDILIVNTLHFNYEWDESFAIENVLDTEFFTFDENVEAVEMMYGIENCYYENKYAKGFSKKFEDGKYSYVAILPNDTNDFSLSSLDIDNLLLSKKEAKVLIGIPKISYQSEIDIQKLASNYKINEVFTEQSNLTKLTDEKTNITKMTQKIKISIGEKGTVNSEISSNSIKSYSEDEYSESILLNRPYAFLIINNETNEVILIGKVLSPNESS